MRRKILEFLAIKLEKETHKKFSAIVAKIGWLAFAVLMVVGTYNAAANYFDASRHLGDGVITETDITLDDTTTEYLKSGERTSYHYSYTYNVGGQDFRGNFTVRDDDNRDYGDGKTVSIVYKQSEPTVSARLLSLEENASFGALVKRFFLLIAVVGVVVLMFFFVITEVFVIQKKNACGADGPKNDG